MAEAEILDRMPRMDWDRPPWNRWSFQHIRNFMPTAQVWRGNDRAKPLPRREKDLLQIKFTRAHQVLQTIDAFLNDSYTDAFLVMADGYIIHESFIMECGLKRHI